MNAKKVIVVLIVLIILLVGGYFLFWGNKSDETENFSEQENVIDEYLDNQPTEEFAMVDVSFFASEVHDALSNIHESIIDGVETSDEQFKTELERLDESMEQAEDIDNYIQSLDDEEYGDLKGKWEAFLNETKTLYENLKDESYEQEKGLILNDNIHDLYDELNTAFENLLIVNDSYIFTEEDATEEPTEEDSNKNSNIVATYEFN